MTQNILKRLKESIGNNNIIVSQSNADTSNHPSSGLPSQATEAAYLSNISKKVTNYEIPGVGTMQT